MELHSLCAVIFMASLGRGSAANISTNAPNDSSIDTRSQDGWCPTRCAHACVLLYRVDCMNVELHILRSSMFPIDSSKIRDLWLDSTSLTTIEANVLDGMIHLKRLSLSNNYLRELDPRLFSNLFDLRHLDLRNNCLVSPLHTGLFESLIQLRTLKLDYNKLTTLNASLLTPIANKIVKITLSNNPFICDCRIRDAVEWFERYGIRSEATCGYPSAGESWDSLPKTGNCKISPLPNVDLTCNMASRSVEQDNNSSDSFPLILVLVVALCGVLVLVCGGLSLYCWRRATRNTTTNLDRRVNENKLYDDIRSNDYYYYETVRAQMPRYQSPVRSSAPDIAPELPKRPQIVHTELYDSCESKRCDDEGDSDSYIKPETAASDEQNIPADTAGLPALKRPLAHTEALGHSGETQNVTEQVGIRETLKDS